MKVKDIMYGCIAILTIAISVSVCVFTYANLSKVKFTCEVGNVKATCYVNYGDEESMSLLYAQVVHAIKNSEKVYKELSKVQESETKQSKSQKKAIERAVSRREKKIEKDKSRELTKEEVYMKGTLDANIESVLEDTTLWQDFMAKYAPSINWDSVMKSTANDPTGGMFD